MKVFKKHHVLFFLLSVMLVLAPLVWFSPADGWDLGGFRLRFLTFNKFMSPVKKEHKAEIASLKKEHKEEIASLKIVIDSLSEAVSALTFLHKK